MQRARQQGSAQEAMRQPPEPVVARQPRLVRVLAGADVQDMALAGRTVGEARTVAQALFGIAGDAVALIDGRRVAENEILGEDQQLEFVKHAGVKGAILSGSRSLSPAAPGAVIELAGDRVTWGRHGRQLGAMSMSSLLTRIEMAGQAPQRWRLYPPHVRLMVERRAGAVMGVVIEMAAGPRLVRWIADDATDPLGSDGCFEQRYLSFPWVVLLIVFVDGELSGQQQAFYRTAPIASLSDELYYTNLLNVAKGYDQESWVCLANLQRRLAPLTWEQRIHAVTDHFWQSSFTRSSEVHEHNSYWSNSLRRKIDRRFASQESWEAATRDHPYFAIEVQWPRTGLTVGDTLARMLDTIAPYRPIERIEQLVTLMQQE
jgi:hypothetical protein